MIGLIISVLLCDSLQIIKDKKCTTQLLDGADCLCYLGVVTEEDYILGTDDEELSRLRFQHKGWVKDIYQLFDLAGLRAGQAVLDLRP